MRKRLKRHQSIPRDLSPTKPCPNPKCRYRLYLTDYKCRRCGIEIHKRDRTPDNIHCSYCREFIPVGSETCPKCGEKVYKPPVVPQRKTITFPARDEKPTSTPPKKVFAPSTKKSPAANPPSSPVKPRAAPTPRIRKSTPVEAKLTTPFVKKAPSASLKEASASSKKSAPEPPKWEAPKSPKEKSLDIDDQSLSDTSPTIQKSRPTILPPDGWKFPESPARKISPALSEKNQAGNPPSPTNNPSVANPPETLVPLSRTSKHSITWLDAFKISVAVAIAPWVQIWILALYELTLQLLVAYICVFEFLNVSCP